MTQVFSSVFRSCFVWLAAVVVLSNTMDLEAKKGRNKNTATAAPQLTVVSPKDGEQYSQSDVIVMQATASDAQEGDLTHWINWHSNRNGWLGIGGEIRPNLAVGTHRLTVHVTDSDGNLTQQVLEFTVNEYVNQAPTIALVEPIVGASYAEGDAIYLVANADDPEQGDMASAVQWSSDRDGYLGQGSGWNTTLSVGTHVLTATVTDEQGESASANREVVVFAPVVEAPELTVLAPAYGSYFDSQSAVVFQATALDAQQGDLTHWVNWHSNLNGWLGIGGEIAKVLKVGTHRITAHVTDSDGNLSQQVFEITVTTGAPVNQAPTLSIAAPLNGAVINSGSAITLAATANDAEDGNLSDYIEWRSNQDGLLTVGAGNSVMLSDGEHVITVSVTDNQGATTEQLINVTVSPISAPQGQAQVTWVAPTENTDNSALTNLAGYRVYYGTSVASIKNQSVWVNAGNLATTITELPNGTYYFTVVAVNSDGLESDFSNIVSKTIN